MNAKSESPEIGWETVVDFTEGGKTKGIPVNNVLKILKEIKKRDGRTYGDF